MRDILVLNAGSTSLKYVLLDGDLEVKKEGRVTDIGVKVKDHNAAFTLMLKDLGQNLEVSAVGHRLVHGGTEFVQPTLLNKPGVVEKLKKYNDLAPLHNPPGIACIEASFANLGKGVINVAVFDTAFYRTLPEVAYRYAIPENVTNEYGIRRFGFHGISHQSVSEQASETMNHPLNKLNLITIHLGGGSSMTAIRGGKAIDTSMGFTPIEGLVMMTRSGDVDATIPLYLQKKARMSLGEVYNLLNRESGMCALSGICSGMLDIIKEYEKGNRRAVFALELYAYRIRKYIGSYLAILGRVDGIIFTGAVGYNSQLIRDMVTKGFDLIKDIPVYNLPPQEEKLIAREIIKTTSFDHA